MTETTIVALIKLAAKSMSDSVTRYWPAFGGNEIAERNQTLYLASVLLHNRWHCWAEPPWKEGAHQRIDLLAWEARSRTLLVTEAKRLYNSAKLASMVSDVKRIDSFLPIQHPEIEDRLRPRQRFGVLLATTWNPRVKTWWTSDDGRQWPRATAIWSSDRSSAIKSASAGAWGAIPLATQSPDGTTGKHQFLFAVWRLSNAR